MENVVDLVKAAVEKFFETDDLRYEPFDENNVAKSSFGIKTKFGHVDTLFIAYDNILIIHSFIPLRVTESQDKVSEFLMRANDGLKTGCFDFDYDIGRISYRVSIFCGKENFAPPTYEQINYAVLISLSTIQRYGDALMKVVFGFAEPKEAIDAIE